MKLTVKQCVDLYNAISSMKTGGIYVRGAKNIDLAINKKLVEPVFEGYKIATEPPEGYKKYIDRARELELKYSNGDKSGNMYNDFVSLKEEFKEEIENFEEYKNGIKNIFDEIHDIELKMLDRDDFCYSEENNSLAPEVLFGLLPCIKD